MAGSGRDSEYESGPSTKKKLRTKIVHKKQGANMHDWELLQQTNYDQSWAVNMFSTKTETTSMMQEQIDYPKKAGCATFDTATPNQDRILSNSTFEHQNFNGISNLSRPLGFNPLTPPGYPNTNLLYHSKQPEIFNQNSLNASDGLGNYRFNKNASLTPPSHTPPMDITPPKSPKSSKETPEKDEDMCPEFIDSCDDTRSFESDHEQGGPMRLPKVNSHGKVKRFKCKQCNYVAVTKLSFWEHTKGHIKPEKMLKCPKCPFVTEYKHHLEYHLRNHAGAKPFQCNKCSYSCVNKSMLNSHLKSHSNVYQYRCANCSYVTKYCHSLKLHLRKYSHSPAMVLNEDGTPNPFPIIDVYGTRRGPKMKTIKKKGLVAATNHETSSPVPQNSPTTKTESLTPKIQTPPTESSNQLQSTMANNFLPPSIADMLKQSGNIGFFPYSYLNLHMLAAQQQATIAQYSQIRNRSVSPLENSIDSEEFSCNNSDLPSQLPTLAINLSSTPIKCKHTTDELQIPTSSQNIEKEESIQNVTHHNMISSAVSDSDTPLFTLTSSFRKKKIAYKLGALVEVENKKQQHESSELDDNLSAGANDKECDSPSSTLGMQDNVDENQSPSDSTTGKAENTASQIRKLFECKFCEISFKDAVLYTIHMGYHGYDDVFKCNMCGEKSEDRVTFFLHIARNSHS